MAEKNGEQEYDFETAKDKGKIEAMLLHVTKVVDCFKKQQQKWNRHNRQRGRRATRASNEEMFDEIEAEKFCVAMDNYFTLPGIIKKLRDKGIGVVGTARLKNNWPPKELKVIDEKDAKFNDFLHL